MQPRERPVELRSTTTRVERAHGHIFITVAFDESGAPFEVFATVGKGDAEEKANAEAICRLGSLWLRSGGDVETLTRQLRGIVGALGAYHDGKYVGSIGDAIATVLDGAGGALVATQAQLQPVESGKETNDVRA